MILVQRLKSTSIIKSVPKFIETVVMSACLITMYNIVRFVCIVTDKEEPRCNLYRLISVLAVVVFTTLVWWYFQILDHRTE